VIRKFVSAREAVSRIPDNAVVAISGFNAATAPFYLIETLLQHYQATRRPKKPVYNFRRHPGDTGVWAG